LNNILKESTMLRKDEEFDDCENMALESNGYPLQQRALLMYTCARKGEKQMFESGNFALARCPPRRSDAYQTLNRSTKLTTPGLGLSSTVFR
jgi:hypothetical protein